MKTKYNEKIRDEICEYIVAGNNRKDSCLLCGITEETFYNWMRPLVKEKKTGRDIKNTQYHPDLVEALNKAEAKLKARNIAIIQRAASGVKVKTKTTKPDGSIVEEEKYLKDPQWTAAAWYLERKYKDEYAAKSPFGGTDDKEVETVIIYKPQKEKPDVGSLEA